VQTQEEILDHITRTIVEQFDPYRIVLFGSRARGDAAEDSDYDILVEMESELPFAKRGAAVSLALWPRLYSLDLVAYTPQESERQRGKIGSIASVAEAEGAVLYERR